MSSLRPAGLRAGVGDAGDQVTEGHRRSGDGRAQTRQGERQQRQCESSELMLLLLQGVSILRGSTRLTVNYSSCCCHRPTGPQLAPWAVGVANSCRGGCTVRPGKPWLREPQCRLRKLVHNFLSFSLEDQQPHVHSPTERELSLHASKRERLPFVTPSPWR